MPNTVAKILLGGSTALNLFGGVADAQSAWKTAAYNRRAVLDDARSVEEAGAMDLRQFDRQSRQLVGSNFSQLSGSNTALSGSAMDIMADTLAQLELERSNRERSTRLQASALRNQAKDYGRIGAESSRRGYLKASGTLLKDVNALMGLF